MARRQYRAGCACKNQHYDYPLLAKGAFWISVLGGREQNHPPNQSLTLGKHLLCLCQRRALNTALFPLLIVQLHLTAQYQSPSSKNTMIPPYLLVITVVQFKDHMEGHTCSTIKQGNTIHIQKKLWDTQENFISFVYMTISATVLGLFQCRFGWPCLGGSFVRYCNHEYSICTVTVL